MERFDSIPRPLRGDMLLSTPFSLACDESPYIGWDEVHVIDFDVHNRITHNLQDLLGEMLLDSQSAWPVASTSDLLDQ